MTESLRLQSRHRQAHQQILAGSLHGAYQRLTQPGLSKTDPIQQLRALHTHGDSQNMQLHDSFLEHTRDTMKWDEIISPDQKTVGELPVGAFWNQGDGI
jgi:hypothetical protein